MHREHLRTILLIVASSVVGAGAWSGHVLALPVAVLFPLLWALTHSRVTAALVSVSYFLAASRGLPQGVAAFYASDLWPGLLLWLCASVGFVVVHTVLWSTSDLARPLRYFLAALLMAVPPFGITGWAHPITSAGVMFPGWGWWGLAATTAGLVGLVSRIWPAIAFALACSWLWSAASWAEPKLAEGWQGIDLEMGASLGRVDNYLIHRTIAAIVTTAR